MNINNLASYTGGNELKKVILLILTLCSFFIYSCDGGGGSSPIGIAGPNDPVEPPDPNNIRSLYGTYELTDMDTWIEGTMFSCNSPNLTGRLVFTNYPDAYYSFDCDIPGIGTIYDDVESVLRIGEESWQTQAELEGENVKFTTGSYIVRGKKISNGTVVDYNLTPFTRTKTPLSADNYSTLTGTYIVEEGKAKIEYPYNGQIIRESCVASFKPHASNRTASIESSTRSVFFIMSFECIYDDNGTVDNSAFGFSQIYSYRDGFVDNNWGPKAKEPIIQDEEYVIVPLSGNVSGSVYQVTGEIKMRKIYDSIEILTRSDY